MCWKITRCLRLWNSTHDTLPLHSLDFIEQQFYYQRIIIHNNSNNTKLFVYHLLNVSRDFLTKVVKEKTISNLEAIKPKRTDELKSLSYWKLDKKLILALNAFRYFNSQTSPQWFIHPSLAVFLLARNIREGTEILHNTVYELYISAISFFFLLN